MTTNLITCLSRRDETSSCLCPLQIGSSVYISFVNHVHFGLVFLQTLRERRTSSEQKEGKTTEKTTDMKVKEADENATYNRCSSVDLAKVYVCGMV